MSSFARVLDEPIATPIPLFELPLNDENTSGGNRRFVPRVLYPFQVRMSDGGSLLDGIDLSFGGLMCSGDDLVWPGNAVSLDLLLPGETTPVSITGRVVDLVAHRDRTAMRIRFENVSDSRRKRIALWMARQANL